ncbi:MAG: PEP-CTERM sorting domain-containing protein [Pirellulales bacterium]|nr:PEP-CTERM sorting domain-containing protein [Pirellulales bacterium]
MTFGDEFSGNIFPTGLLQTQIDAAYEAVSRSSAAPTVDVSFAITGGLGTTVPEPTTMVMAGLGIIGLEQTSTQLVATGNR